MLTVLHRFTYVMVKTSCGYSIKKIPESSEKRYLFQLMKKIKTVINRMRCREIYPKEIEKNDKKMK